jgi:hypothetical protein
MRGFFFNRIRLCVLLSGVRNAAARVSQLKETPMTALIYAFSRFYQALIEARMKQAEIELQRILDRH